VPDGDVIAFATSCSSQFSMIVPSGINVLDGSHSDCTYVVVDGDSGPPGSEHVPPVGVGLAEEDVPVAGVVEAVVEPSDP
jgi:hypothetical protein